MKIKRFSKKFGRSLRHYRGVRSQREFAEFLNLSSQAIYQRYEAGRIPSYEVLRNIAKLLGVTVARLLGNEFSIYGGKPPEKPILVHEVTTFGPKGAHTEKTDYAEFIETQPDDYLLAEFKKDFESLEKVDFKNKCILLAFIETQAAELRKRWTFKYIECESPQSK